MIFDKLKKLVENSQMDKLLIRHVDNDTFIVISLACANSKTYVLEDSSPIFSLEENGGLPQDLFEFLAKASGIPIEHISLHIINILQN